MVLYLSLYGVFWSLMIALLTDSIPIFVGSVLVINDSTIDWYYTFRCRERSDH